MRMKFNDTYYANATMKTITLFNNLKKLGQGRKIRKKEVTRN